MIEESNGRIESAANEDRSSCVILALILKLGNLVSIVLKQLKVVVDERTDEVDAEAEK